MSVEFFRNEEKNEDARELLVLEETELLLNGAGRAIGVLVGFTLLLLITGTGAGAGCAPDCPHVF